MCISEPKRFKESEREMTSYVFNLKGGILTHARRFDNMDEAIGYAQSVWDSLTAEEIRTILATGYCNITVEYNGTVVWDFTSQFDGVEFRIEEECAVARVVWLTLGRAVIEIEHHLGTDVYGYQYVPVDSHEDLYRQIQIIREAPQLAFGRQSDIWGVPVFHLFAHERMTAEQLEEVIG